MSTAEHLSQSEHGLLAPVRVVAAGAAPRLDLRRVLVVLDAAAVSVAWAASLLLAGSSTGEQVLRVDVTLLTAIVLTAVSLVLIAGQRLYLARVCSIRAVEITRLGRAAAGAGLCALLLPRFLPVDVGLAAAAAGTTTAFAGTLTARGAYRSWLRSRRSLGQFMRPVVIVGANPEAADLCRLLADHPEMGYRVVGAAAPFGDIKAADLPVPHVATLENAVERVAESQASGVLLVASALEPATMNGLVREFMRHGVHVHLSSGLRGIDHRRLRAQPIAHEPLLYVEPLQLARWQFVLKRTIDLVVTVMGGVLVALPVGLLAAAAVKLQDRGPVLYKQERIGRHGRPFTIWKLRTMVPDADKLYDTYVQSHAGRNGPLIKLADDPRRTRVGRWLERFSIDELPQLWNVLNGTMSLVGPRPAQAKEVAEFDEELLQRLEVLPGITGLWQVEARDNPSFAAYRRYDLFYIENWSVALDLAILVETFQRVLGRGAGVIFRRRERLRAVASPAGD